MFDLRQIPIVELEGFTTVFTVLVTELGDFGHPEGTVLPKTHEQHRVCSQQTLIRDRVPSHSPISLCNRGRNVHLNAGRLGRLLSVQRLPRRGPPSVLLHSCIHDVCL